MRGSITTAIAIFVACGCEHDYHDTALHPLQVDLACNGADRTVRLVAENGGYDYEFVGVSIEDVGDLADRQGASAFESEERRRHCTPSQSWPDKPITLRPHERFAWTTQQQCEVDPLRDALVNLRVCVLKRCVPLPPSCR